MMSMIRAMSQPGLFQGSTRLRILGDAGVEVLHLADEGAFPTRWPGGG